LRTIFKFVAWVGLGIFTGGVGIAIYIWIASLAYRHGPNLPLGIVGWWIIIVPVALAGLVLMYVGGLIARPLYFWIACVSIGILYIIVSVPPEWSVLVGRVSGQGISGLLTDLRSYLVSPGLAAIFLGIVITVLDKITEKNQRVALS
jgi:hypothetical protein